MATKNNLGYDLVEILTTFNLSDSTNCTHLNDWLQATYVFNTTEQEIINDLFADIEVSGEYMNEEELKARVVGLVFYAAKIDVPNRLRVFYERPLSAIVENISLSVVTDCMVARPLRSSPVVPYFFLQEFKKAKGEKKDPEAQMLTAMLIAQYKNNNDKPIYGSYMIGTSWHFTTLIGKEYCVSKKFEATNKQDLLQIVCVLRKLKELILNF